MTRDDESQARVTRITVTPNQIEMLSAPTVAPRCIPARGELRAARDAHAARVPLARLPAPVFGWNTDDETLAAFFPAAGKRGATPNVFHPRPKTMFIYAPPVSRPICRTHKFLV